MICNQTMRFTYTVVFLEEMWLGYYYMGTKKKRFTGIWK
jgi:hypothetical protein